ncbi:hypothetical protein [Archangium gephyra]|nr:hypothetical protein [Archangium gephyra]
MTMREVQRYSLVEVDPASHLVRVTRDGVPLGFTVTGVRLEAQFELGDGSGLLWMTEDSPYDEGLHVYLLGRDGGLEDALEAGATFSPGILALRSLGAEWVEFEFFQNGFLYRLEVAKQAGFRLFPPAGWKYKRRWAKHRLAVTVARKEGA